MRHLVLLPLLLAAAPLSAAEIVCDGPFAIDSSEARLIEVFGRDNVVSGEVPGPEGTTVFATTVYPDDPERSMEFGWWDEEAREGLAYATIARADTAPGGLRYGMSIAEAEELNGDAFELTGFWWDYGGYSSFLGGALGDLEGGCRLSAGFEPTADVAADVDLTPVAGDILISSDEPLLELLEARVRSITIGYPRFDAEFD